MRSNGVRSGPLTAQVFYEEFHDGKPVLPVSGIRIDLGPKGQLLSLTSDYATDVNVVNQERIDMSQARKKAVEAVLAQSPELGHVAPTMSQPVIWVHSPREAYSAFRVIVDGREVVINSQDGSVLINRDRRQF